MRVRSRLDEFIRARRGCVVDRVSSSGSSGSSGGGGGSSSSSSSSYCCSYSACRDRKWRRRVGVLVVVAVCGGGGATFQRRGNRDGLRCRSDILRHRSCRRSRRIGSHGLAFQITRLQTSPSELTCVRSSVVKVLGDFLPAQLFDFFQMAKQDIVLRVPGGWIPISACCGTECRF